MPSPEMMRSALLRYLEQVERNDVDGVLSLFADSVSVEDPVGGPPGTHVVGIEKVSAFFRKGFKRSQPSPSRTGPVVTTGGNEAAVPFTLRLKIGDRVQELDVVDVVQFDEDGCITSLRAFWNFDERREVPAEEPE